MTTLRLDGSETGNMRRIFPKQFDNNFRGHWLALWLFGFYVLGKLGQGLDSIFNTYAVATGADGIPLDNYSAAAAQDMLSMFALLGLNVLVLPSLGVVALIRYRAMIPLVCVMLLFLNFGARAVRLLHPDASSGGAQPRGFYVNLALLAVLAAAFALSLIASSARQPATRSLGK